LSRKLNLESSWLLGTARRNEGPTDGLFRAPDPFESPEGVILDGSHVHRTVNGEMVRSKSEVIVANTLRLLDIPYLYEEPLRMADGTGAPT
jgi:hypothetical protein